MVTEWEGKDQADAEGRSGLNVIKCQRAVKTILHSGTVVCSEGWAEEIQWGSFHYPKCY